MTTPTPDLTVRLLLEQLEIAWGFAERFVLPRVDLALCTWEPSENVVTVHPQGDRWSAEWPDEEATPLAEVTVGWLLWHIDWWWGNTVRACDDLDPIPAQDHLWSGSVQSIRATKQEWQDVLSRRPIESTVSGVMPEPKPLWFVAGWVNFELTKNISEINQLITRRSNTPDSRH